MRLPLLNKGWRKSEIGDRSDPALHARLESISPVNTAHRIKRRLMLIIGDQDPRFPVPPVRKVRDSISRAGGTVWYQEFEGLGHSLEPRGFLEALYRFGSIFEFVETVME